jgi:hypothetical protein
MLLAVSGGARAADTPCDRACLNGFVDQYLSALVAHDPSKLPLTKNARYTENGQTLKLGDGMWGPVVTMGTYKLYFADPKAGRVVENRKISEMETILIRSTSRGSFSSPQDLKDQPVLNEIVAPADRNTRDEMVTIPNSYFEGLEKATDKYTPFGTNCKRIEKGQVTSSKSPITRMSCGDRFATGFSRRLLLSRSFHKFSNVFRPRGQASTRVSTRHARVRAPRFDMGVYL